MKPYADAHGHSGVAAFDCGRDWIEIAFKGSDVVYRYTYRSTGAEPVEDMKRLAEAGDGLSAYVSRNVNVRYESKRPRFPPR